MDEKEIQTTSQIVPWRKLIFIDLFGWKIVFEKKKDELILLKRFIFPSNYSYLISNSFNQSVFKIFLGECATYGVYLIFKY